MTCKNKKVAANLDMHMHMLTFQTKLCIDSLIWVYTIRPNPNSRINKNQTAKNFF